MKKNSRINRLMLKWSYKEITEPPLQLSRELKISEILDLKTKDKWDVFFGCKNNSSEFKERMEVFNWFRSQGKSDDEIKSIWQNFRSKYKYNSEYKKMPKKQRKDNGHPELDGINYNGGGWNRNKIRVPSKKRKNKWKRFKKLFPEYCERNGL